MMTENPKSELDPNAESDPSAPNAADKFRRLVGNQEPGDTPTGEQSAFDPQFTRYLDEQLHTMALDSDGNPIPFTWGRSETDDTPVSSNQGQQLPPGMIPPAAHIPAGTPTPRPIPTAPPPFSQTPTPQLRKPAVDRNGMPLPKQVDQFDLNATRVIPVKRGLPGTTPTSPTTQPAFNQNIPVGQRPVAPPTTRQLYPVDQRGNTQSPPPQVPTRGKGGKSGSSNPSGCLLKGFIGLLFLLVLGFVLVGSFMVIEYYSIARNLPGIEDLKSRSSQFETTRILDREGNVLYEILDPSAGRRTYTPLNEISPYMVAATIATEDKEFYNHPGFNVFAISRAMWQNYTSGQIESGASTITQQLARTLLFTPDERYEQSIRRKTREIVLASEITRRYSKDEILELYLNENNYGNLAYGVEAAAETYFNTTADKLNLAQASFLSGLPQAPSVYDIHTNREATLNRQKQVLLLLLDTSSEKDCIFVSNNEQRVCVTPEDVLKSANEIEAYNFKPVNFEMTFPHWVNYIRSLLEEQYDPQTIYRSGFTVHTTIDPELQRYAEEVVKQQVADLEGYNATDGAVVVMEPSTGKILAMVGSADFYNEEISGQVNMAVSPRQPGSSIKPLTYTAAFEKGWTPSTLIWDVPSEFPPSGREDDPSEPYKPVNYDGNFHGPVTVRSALANSYNVPAVKALNFVGIYDNPETDEKEGFIEFAKRLGIDTLTRDDYGLSLTLGGGDVTLLQLTGAFSVLGNGGIRVPPVAIEKIETSRGEVVFEYQPEEGEEVVRKEHAYLISSILSDQEARAPMFGTRPVINLPFTSAVKTGTTNDFRDNWTIGYTPDLAVGVWVGNADYKPMQNTTGLTGAAPIWANIMQYGIERYTQNNPSGFERPDTIVRKQICAVSGTEPSEWCPDTRKEFFAADQPPLPKEQDLWQNININTWTGLISSEDCGELDKEVFTINVTDKFARKWLTKTDAGKAWLKENNFKKPYTFTPTRACKEDDPQATLRFVGLQENEKITEEELDIEIQAYGDGYKSVGLAYGEGRDPKEWTFLVKQREERYRNPEVFYTWDLAGFPSGAITLKLTMYSENEGYAERIIHLVMQVPTPTPTLTPTETPTEIPTETPEPTEVPPTEEPTEVPPTNTPEVVSPSDTPTP